LIKAYFNDKAGTWDEVVAEKDTARLRGLASRFSLSPGSTVLDAGTGTGILVPFLLETIGDTGILVALDFAEEMLKVARRKGFGNNIQYVNADVSSLPICTGTVDTVVCYSSFPHFQDKLRALNELHRVLKEGGRLFICHTSSRAVINDIHRQIPLLKEDTLPDTVEMKALLSAAGFARISLDDSAHSYFVSAAKP